MVFFFRQYKLPYFLMIYFKGKTVKVTVKNEIKQKRTVEIACKKSFLKLQSLFEDIIEFKSSIQDWLSATGYCVFCVGIEFWSLWNQGINVPELIKLATWKNLENS